MKTKTTETSDKTTSHITPPPTNSYENFDSQLNEWSKKLDEFKHKLTRVGSDIQNEAKQKIEDLELKYKTASEKINDLKDKGLFAKDEMKTGFEKAWKELLQAYESARKTFH